jgi:hypothetical protein
MPKAAIVPTPEKMRYHIDMAEVENTAPTGISI